MDALHALHTRSSANLLCEPGPSKLQIDNIVKAGLRACDHRCLRPWRYLIIQGSARDSFGDLMVDVLQARDGAALDEKTKEKVKGKPQRAPTILVVIAKLTPHPSVPEIEQLLSAGASAQMMMTAAYAQGVGAIWRSGGIMFEEGLRQGLGLSENERLIGFIYLGTPKVSKPAPELDPDDFLSAWPAIPD
ncbi:nitroreductase family protein [Arenicella xantha]|uniref:Putative NAD(P)H nitroreductase n=1 Tax=Arenicella xantha TaxID=644221 RepID=A0A395JPF3_9GAMM|nr:nitroreductase family protein [Arenicella xantha]RBP51458.1 nitroreductase [Arenicella xantha]